MRNDINLRLGIKSRAMAQRTVFHIDETFDGVAVASARGGVGGIVAGRVGVFAGVLGLVRSAASHPLKPRPLRFLRRIDSLIR